MLEFIQIFAYNANRKFHSYQNKKAQNFASNDLSTLKLVQLFSHNRSSKIGNFYQLGGKVNYAHQVVTRNHSSNICGADAHNSCQLAKKMRLAKFNLNWTTVTRAAMRLKFFIHKMKTTHLSCDQLMSIIHFSAKLVKIA